MLIKTTNTDDDGAPVTRSLRCSEDPNYVVEFRGDGTARVRESIGTFLVESDRYPTITEASDSEADDESEPLATDDTDDETEDDSGGAGLTSVVADDADDS